ncbi:nose resistant to fluoxetine protein 6 [Daphnia magna]|uniref:nose resistant to fluoxetine protein 6 n=1 Tax=Daphnia magna TaxID=35525 RepID=UPI001E1B9F7B|nr:nose resistant to fluoxetine protein 6 [Daphnia magna]
MQTTWMVVLTVGSLWTGGQSQQFANLATSMGAGEESLETLREAITKKLEETGTSYDASSIIHNVLAALKSSSFPTAVANNISQRCLEDSQYYVHSLYANRSLWALQMQESSGQLPPGLFGAGNVHADGLFDECLAVRAPSFDGQYCSVFFKPALVDKSELVPPDPPDENSRSNFITIFQLFGILGQISGSGRVEPKLSGADSGTYVLPSVSFCLPSSCSAADLGQAVAQLVGPYVFGNYSIVTVTDEQYCFKEERDHPTFDGPDITVIIVLSLVGLLVTSATVHEAWRMYFGIDFDSKTDGPFVNSLHCFSALSNGRKILSMKQSTSNDNFGCIHGLRFFSTCWVVIGHTWILGAYKSMNPRAVKTDAYTWGMQSLANGTVSVDTFFLMSGLLVSFLLLRELDRNNGKFNVGLYYLHRYLRLTPVYAIILGFVATLMVYLGTGPNWYSVNLASYGCRIVWWKHFLYITNLFPGDPDISCMGQTWYLEVDMQLFVVAPLFVYPLWRWRKVGLVWLATVTMACLASIFAAYAVYDLLPTLMFTRVGDVSTSADYFNHYYVKPWTRAPPYLVGIWFGWYLHVTKQSEVRLAKLLVALGWTLSTIVALAIIYGLTPYVDRSQVPEISSAVSMTYGPLHRFAWGIVIGWIIFACSRGYGGFVNRILSWKGFVPLGRLTYCVYLIHYDYLNVFYAALRKQYYYTMLGQFTICFGVLLICFGLAFATAVTLEASFLNLEKLFFAPKPKSLSPRNYDVPKAIPDITSFSTYVEARV